MVVVVVLVMVDCFDDRAQHANWPHMPSVSPTGQTILGRGAGEDGVVGSESPMKTAESSALDGVSGRSLFAPISEMGMDSDVVASSLSGTISLKLWFGGITTSIFTCPWDR